MKPICEEEEWCKNRSDFKVGSKPVCTNHLPKAIRQVRQITSIVNGGIGEVIVGVP